jgi:hypothetical protein
VFATWSASTHSCWGQDYLLIVRQRADGRLIEEASISLPALAVRLPAGELILSLLTILYDPERTRILN